MGGSSSKSNANQDSSVHNSTSGSAQSLSVGEEARVNAVSIGDIQVQGGAENSAVNLSITDYGSVLAAVDLAENVSLSAVEMGRAVAGYAFGTVQEITSDALDLVAKSGTQAEAATREAMAAVSKSAQNDASELVATMAKYGAVVVVVVAVVLLVRSRK